MGLLTKIPNLSVPDPQKWKTCSSLSLLIFCTFMAGNIYSLQGPFYPAEAEKKGLNSIESGIVLGIYQISAIIFSPVLPYIIHKSSVYTVFQIAVLTIGSTTLIFGFLDQLNSSTWFLLSSILLRILGSFGTTAIFITNSMFALGMFPKSIATVFAIIETTYACGMAVGPAIGSAVYSVGARINFAFTLPFLTFGILFQFVSIFACYTLKQQKVSDNHASLQNERIGVGYVKLVKVNKIALYTLPGFGVGLVLGFVTALLEPHLRQFSSSPGTVGLMFLIFGGTYAIGTILWGYMLDHILPGRMNREISAIIGCILIIISFVFLGPVSFMPIYPSIALTSSSLAFLGIGKAGVTISTFSIMLSTGASSSISQADVLSFWNAVYGIGAFIGPILGGWLLQSFGFRQASLVPLLLFLIIGLLLLMSLILEFQRRSFSSTKLENNRNPELQNLININN